MAANVPDAFFGEPSPYPGLRPYEAGEERFFYGRDGQVEEIAARLGQQHIVAVLGGSGCGKSSIVRAGLIPYLRRKGIPGRYDLWLTAVFTPQEEPLDRLAVALGRLLMPAGDRPTESVVEEVKQSLESSSGLGGFLDTFRARLFLPDGLPDTVRDRFNILVVFDQFEELFREANRRRSEAESLARLLVDTWHEKPEGTYALLTMRTEDMHHCATFLELPDLLNEAGYLTRRLDEAEIGEAIVRPGQRLFLECGVYESAPRGGEAALPFAPEVVQRLQQAVAAFAWNPDHLPLLQHVLCALWRTVTDRWARDGGRREGDSDPHGERWQISLRDLRTAVGLGEIDELPVGETLLGSAVETTAEAILAQLPPSTVPPINTSPDELQGAQKAIAYAFTLLATQGEQTTFTRRWTSRSEVLAVSGLAPATLETALAAFVSPYPLLRDDGEETQDSEAKIDVAHESFIRNWPRFKDWLKRDRWARETYLTVAERSREWDEFRVARGGLAAWSAWWLGEYRLTAKQLNRADRLTEGRLGVAWAARYDSSYKAARAEAGTDDVKLAEAMAAQQARFAGQLQYLRRSAWSSKVASAAIPLTAVAVIVVTAGVLAYIQGQREESAELRHLNAKNTQLAKENQQLAELSALTTLTTLAAAMAFQNGDPAIYASDVPIHERVKAVRETALALHIADLVDRLSETVPRPMGAEEASKTAAKIARLEMAQRTAQRFADAGARRGLEAFRETKAEPTWDIATINPESVEEQFKTPQTLPQIKIDGDDFVLERASGNNIPNLFAAANAEFPLQKYAGLVNDRGETIVAYAIGSRGDADNARKLSTAYLIRVEGEADQDFAKVARMPYLTLGLSALPGVNDRLHQPVVDFALGRDAFDGQLLLRLSDGSTHAVPLDPRRLIAPLCGLLGAPQEGEGTAIRQMIIDSLKSDDVLKSALTEAASDAGAETRDEVARLLENPLTAACVPRP